MHDDTLQELIEWLVEQEAPDGIATPTAAEIHARIAVSDSGADLGQIKELDFGGLVDVTDNGDGSVTISGTDTDTHIDIEDDAGNLIASNVSAVQTGSNLSASDNGDGTATLSGGASKAKHVSRDAQGNVNFTQYGSGATSAQYPNTMSVSAYSTANVQHSKVFLSARGNCTGTLSLTRSNGTTSTLITNTTLGFQEKKTISNAPRNSSGTVNAAWNLTWAEDTTTATTKTVVESFTVTPSSTFTDQASPTLANLGVQSWRGTLQVTVSNTVSLASTQMKVYGLTSNNGGATASTTGNPGTITANSTFTGSFWGRTSLGRSTYLSSVTKVVWQAKQPSTTVNIGLQTRLGGGGTHSTGDLYGTFYRNETVSL